MLNIEKYVAMTPEQWEIVIEGMRNPKNSYDRIDSYATYIRDYETNREVAAEFFIGPNDQKLMMELKAGGPVHAKYLRMMPVWVTLTAPLYWWKEFDTYKVGTVANSCSTMHKIHAKEFTLEDFSTEQLMSMDNHYDERDIPTVDVSPYRDRTVLHSPIGHLKATIELLNNCREKFLECDEKLKLGLTVAKRKHVVAQQKYFWWQMIQLLPSSYNQKRTVFLNYEVLSNIYKWRRNHKLDEWHVFCDWIETLPYPELITGEVKNE